MNKLIGLRKIATMQNMNINDVATDAIEMYIGVHQKTIEDYDCFFGTGENELYEDGKDQFHAFLRETQTGDMALIAQRMIENPHLPEMIWRFDQLKEFADKYMSLREGVLEQLWDKFEESINE